MQFEMIKYQHFFKDKATVELTQKGELSVEECFAWIKSRKLSNDTAVVATEYYFYGDMLTIKEGEKIAEWAFKLETFILKRIREEKLKVV
jgi:hypothetical protein